MQKYLFSLLFLLILLNVNGCSSRPNYAHIDDVTRGNKITRGLHVVDNGESLYSIAFSYGLDFRELAAVNGIKYPYKILPGQKIALNQTTYNRSKNNKINRNSLKARNKNQSTSQYLSQKNQENQDDSIASWVWPARGQIKTKFKQGHRFNKGIDIAVNSTTSVRASAAGVVVYRGAGLKGYGKLIIIKHSDKYLSAYAHNDWLLVNEGDKVKRGQKIASIGEKTKLLHFEIREYGKPADPLKYLP